MSKGEVNLSTTTLYGALGRLLDQGLIARVPDGAGVRTGPGLPRKAYFLSETGQRMLKAATSRRQALVVVLRLRLRQGGYKTHRIFDLVGAELGTMQWIVLRPSPTPPPPSAFIPPIRIPPQRSPSYFFKPLSYHFLT